MLFWRGGRYTINVLYRCGVSYFSCGGYRSPLISMGSVGKFLVVCQCIMIGGLEYPLSYVLVEHGRLCQKGGTFRHYHHVVNCLRSCSYEFSALFLLFDQSGKGFCRVLITHHLHRIFFLVNFIYHPIAFEVIL